MSILVQFLVGLTLGLGLLLAGMSNPAKVLNFLDLGAIPGGGWDPSLAFVMAGAIAVTFVGYRVVLLRPRPLLGGSFQLPGATAIDARILTGSAIFGLGWGLAGLCPGPAFTALGTGGSAAVIFVATMFLGMGAARWLANRPTASRPTASRP